MDGQVRSRLLLLQPEARYQRVAVHRVPGLRSTYDVLFLGTGECLQPSKIELRRGIWAWLVDPRQWVPPGLELCPCSQVMAACTRQ